MPLKLYQGAIKALLSRDLICVLILLYMCPHTDEGAIKALFSRGLIEPIYILSYCYVCVLICPHTAIYVSSYCYICVLILLKALLRLYLVEV